MGDDSELDLPPNTDNVRNDSYLIMSKPTRLLTFTPHMHTRGKAMCLEVIYPEKSKKRDGSRVELLSCANNFNFNWMMAYEYASDVQPLLPAGSVLHFQDPGRPQSLATSCRRYRSSFPLSSGIKNTVAIISRI